MTKSRSPASQISTFSALVSPLFSADCRQSGKEWLNLSLCNAFVSGTFLNYLCFWSFSCPLRPQKDLVPDTLSLFTGKSVFPYGRDIGILCGQLEYPSPSLGSHDVSDVRTNILSPCWAVLPKYPARCKGSSLSVIFSFVKWHRLEWAVITLTCYID